MVNHAHDAYESMFEGATGPPASRMSIGVRGGLIAAAATAGAVIGFGVRHGDWSAPFANLGFEVLSSLGLGVPAGLRLVTGFLTHAAWMIVWGIVFAMLSTKRTAGTAIVLAIVVSVLAAVLARSVLPSSFGAVRFASLPGAQVALCVALMALSLLSARAFNQAR